MSSDYQPRFNIVLHQPEIPGNTGAIGRTCVALQAKLWLVQPLGFRVDEKTLRRAGLDYWQYLEWELVPNWQGILDRAGEQNLWAFTKTAAKEFSQVKYSANDWLVFGSETSGLPSSIVEQQDVASLRIPMGSHVRSLNLSGAVAVAGYECHRQLDSDSPISD